MSCFTFDLALLRLPGPSSVHGLREHDGPSPDFAALVEEHLAYAEALEEAGVTIFLLDPLDEHPDAIFVEDPALVFPEGAILLRPGTASRAGETDYLRSPLAEHFTSLLELGNGHVEGGDVLVTPDLVLIGLSARTDRIGAEALQHLLAQLGRRSQVVAPPTGMLHLKTQATLLDEETMLVTSAAEASGIFSRFRQIVTDPREANAANSLRINDRLIVSAQHRRTNSRLAQEGYDLLPVDTTHIERLDAGLTCLSLRWAARPRTH